MKVTHIFILVVLVMIFSYNTTGSQENKIITIAKKDSSENEISSVYRLKIINDSASAAMEATKELVVIKKQLSTYQYLKKELLAYSYRMKNIMYSKKQAKDTIFKYVYLDEEGNSLSTTSAREKNIDANIYIEPKKDSIKKKKTWFLERWWNKLF